MAVPKVKRSSTWRNHNPNCNTSPSAPGFFLNPTLNPIVNPILNRVLNLPG